MDPVRNRKQKSIGTYLGGAKPICESMDRGKYLYKFGFIVSK